MAEIEDIPSAGGSTVGLSTQGREALELIEAKKWFSNGAATFRAAATYAIAKGISPSSDGAFNTVWSVATIDKEGDFKPIIELLVGESVTWDFIQKLGDAGLREMAKDASAVILSRELLIRNEEGIS